ncbi:MAG: prolyl oligopeptidase family serine peptidase [Planctomycetota bacterium]
MSLRTSLGILMIFVVGLSLQKRSPADGPEDNLPENVRPIPPVVLEIPTTLLEALNWRCRAVRAQWESAVKRDPSIAGLRSEILVFPRAVELAIEFRQFYKPDEPEHASALLDEAARRMSIAVRGGSWADVVGIKTSSEPQLIVGGYESSIDGSIQPYGLVVPAGLNPSDGQSRRLDLWFHGRGEKLSEVAFLHKQQRDQGQYTPNNTIVLHPYGRYSNAFKFAGEVDVLEALGHIQSRLSIDASRIGVRGFSMGGAACWQFATHYADRWFAANPGAGFSETPEFLATFQKENVRTTAPDFQQRLWQLYDCPHWAINLVHCPTIAYSGELDRQKQAADVMQNRLRTLGIDLVHVIGPQTAHKIHPDSKIEIEARMDALAKTALNRMPDRVQFTTVTLRYPNMHWVELKGLQEHWIPAEVEAAIQGGSQITATTKNIARLRFNFPPGQWPGHPRGAVDVVIDGDRVQGPLVRSDRSWSCELMKVDSEWKLATPAPGLKKRPGLQGPIDDAFMSSFLFVLPSEQSTDEVIDRWVESESLHAMLHWRKHFRGDIRQKIDTDVTPEDIATSNLILFGDPDSNQLIKKLLPQLPVQWDEDTISIGEARVKKSDHVPVLIYPNPLNVNRYIVINSGFTFREYDYLNNARQTPKLPDWALIDVSDGATTQLPGMIKEAGFFDESWQP